MNFEYLKCTAMAQKWTVMGLEYIRLKVDGMQNKRYFESAQDGPKDFNWAMCKSERSFENKPHGSKD